MPRLMKLQQRPQYVHYSTVHISCEELNGIISSRKVLKPAKELQLEFINANCLDHEKKVTEYWNFLVDEITKHRSGYFLCRHPSPDIHLEICLIAHSYGYKIEFKKDQYHDNVYYVVLNDGKSF